MTRAQIVLDADVYDTLELGALAFGRIGAGMDFIRDYQNGQYSFEDAPIDCYCAHGMVADERPGDAVSMSARGGGRSLLIDAGIGRADNDGAVVRVNQRKGASGPYIRISFKEWCKELNVVRGPSKPADLWAGMPDETISAATVQRMDDVMENL